MDARLLASALLLSCLPAQDRTVRAQPALPRLFHVGPLPAGAPVFDLLADGALARDGTSLTVAAFEQQLEAGVADIVLRADRLTPAGVVPALLDLCRSRNVAIVWFAATLPDGTGNGCFGYALPAAAELACFVTLRLHRDRVGVPPDSAEPHLRRIARALATARPTWVLGIDATGDTSLEALLQVMAAAAQAGVPRAFVTAQRTAAQQLSWEQHPRDLVALAASARTQPGAMALDLGPLPTMQVPAQALPRAKAVAEQRPVGLLLGAQANALQEPGRGWGGRYGGRAGGRLAVRAGGIAEAIELGPTWILRQQMQDGSWPDAMGRGDVEGTALVVLAFHGDGQTMESGQDTEAIQRGVGWLMSQQQLDGRIGPPGSGCVRRHALAVYALVEAGGLSPNGAVVRGHVEDALGWLQRQRLAGGGWNDGTAGAPADAITTSWCMLAAADARYFRVDTALNAIELVAWFDSVAEPGGVHRLHADAAADDPLAPTATAAALFSRLYAGQDPSKVPVMRAAADEVLLRADCRDPLGGYFATYSLYQMGGKYWREWSRRLNAAIVLTQITDGDAKGSWAPAGGNSAVVTTALRMLTLEAYYRYTKLVR